MPSKKIIFFLCIYKMIPISKEEYENSEKQKYRQELTPNAEYQRCWVFVRNDLVERKIKS